MKKIKAGIVSVLLICCILCSPINLICAANKENTDSEQIADAKTIMAIWYWEMQYLKKELENNA